MRLEAFPLEFQGAMPILRKLQEAGYEAYYVGGSVRDILLNKPIHDVDIATSAFPAEVKELFHRTIDVGIDHGTVMVITKEATYDISNGVDLSGLSSSGSCGICSVAKGRFKAS